MESKINFDNLIKTLPPMMAFKMQDSEEFMLEED